MSSLRVVLVIMCLVLVVPSWAQGPIKIEAPEGTDVTVQLNYSTDTANWAGAFMWLRNWDPSEVDIVSVTGLLGSNKVWSSPFGPASSNSASIQRWFTTFFQSPTTMSATPVPIFSVVVRPKNTSTGANSDADFDLGFGPIFHAIASATRYSPDFSWSTIPTSTIASTQGHMISGSTFVQVSEYYGWLNTAASFGIDHGEIPEPGSMVLLGSGLICLAIGFRRRRRKA